MSSPRPPHGEPADGTTTGTTIKQLRLAKYWSPQQLAQRMASVAARQEGGIPVAASLKVMIGRWEQGRRTPGDYYKRLLAVALDVPMSRLGSSDDLEFIYQTPESVDGSPVDQAERSEGVATPS